MRSQCSMPNCDKPPREGQRYCKVCHSLYMKAWRAKQRLAQIQLQASVVNLRAKVVARDQEIAELKVG